jgi:uncharacterized RDD family membrane protein YckC
MFCSNCGQPIAEQASFCPGCGSTLLVAPQPAAVPGILQPAPPVRYAGFWRRFLAVYIDGVVIGSAMYIIILPFVFVTVAADRGFSETPSAAGTAFMGVMGLLWLIMALIIPWIYEAAMISSDKQATLGKRAVGIVVTDLEGNRITFGRATGRYFGKYLSSLILLIGFIMAAFTEKKQALHDIMAGCLLKVKD